MHVALFISSERVVVFLKPADSPSRYVTVGISAAPPVSSVVDREIDPGVRESNLFAAERKIHLDVLLVALGSQSGLSKTAHALGVFATVQVSFTLFPTQYATAACHLESLGDTFSCFCFSTYSCHSVPSLSRIITIAMDYPPLFHFVCQAESNTDQTRH